jgi:hypothetical protein
VRGIIGNCIVTAMKQRGGKSSALIQPAPRERCGLKRIRLARMNWLVLPQILAFQSLRDSLIEAYDFDIEVCAMSARGAAGAKSK